MDTNSDIKKVENELFDLFESDSEVTESLKSFLKAPSKRIRSIFAILYLKSNNCEITDDVISLLTAGEIIHNASLLHDDVIDEAETRRGETAISKKFDSKISILSGDYLLSVAVKILLKLNNDEILNTFLNCTEKMCKAEIKQYLLRGKIPAESEYIEICEGKTSSLFGAILKSAAIIKNLDKNRAERFGTLLGTLFQINNDSSEESIKSDKKNGIHTSLEVLGIEKTNALKDNYKEEMRAITGVFPNKTYSSRLIDLAVNL